METKPLYDDFYIELARERGLPDPEENVRRANEVFLPLIQESRFDEARKRLGEITDPMMRQDLEQLVSFHETCLCLSQ